MRSPTEGRTPTGAGPRQARRHERWTVRLLDGLLVAAGLAGLGAIAWVVLTVVLGFQLVAFATGSMSPAFPAGSLALSRAVPLSAVHQGDVVTVERGHGLLPITHRVFSIDRHGDVADLVLKGDANRYQDPSPYRVRAVREVVLPLAALSTPIRLATAPIGVGTGAAVAAAAVMWATWPSKRRVASAA